MRSMGLVVLVCLGACTRPNAGFGGSATESGTDPSEGQPTTAEATTAEATTAEPTTAEPTTSEPTTSEPTTAEPTTSEPTTGESTTGLEPTCSQEPAEGAIIRLGDPMAIGACPGEFGIWTQLLANDGDEVTLDTCGEGCKLCDGADGHPLSVHPLTIGNHLPPSTCLRLEARELVLQDETRCHYGALTIFDPPTNTAYVIATMRNHAPTLAVNGLLGGAVPAIGRVPLECECSAVVPEDDCCAMSDGLPTFWPFMVDGQSVLPGETAPMELGDLAGLDHTFHLLQAQELPTCDAPGLQTSWAIVATL